MKEMTPARRKKIEARTAELIREERLRQKLRKSPNRRSKKR